MSMGSAMCEARSETERTMAQQINPAWKQYNDINNEGGEGYNPHPKFVGEATAEEALSCTDSAGFAISRGEAEYLLGEEQRLLRDAESRANGGDLSAAITVDKIKARIAHYQSQLA